MLAFKVCFDISYSLSAQKSCIVAATQQVLWRINMINETDNKEERQINTIDDALSVIEKFDGKYPKDAVEFLVNNKDESIPKLLEIIGYVLSNYKSLDDGYFAALHAMFLLAQFREKKPLMAL